MKNISNLLQEIVADSSLHARWLNTLSMMENTGARKIKNCEHPIFVNEIILKHAAEEARHAYYLKRQIAKIEANACPTYERRFLVAPLTSLFYLQKLDVRISRFLKDSFGFPADKLKYASYLLVTYAIEVRADELYPIYQDALTGAGSSVSVKTIIAEEKNHLKEMEDQLREFSPDWEALCHFAVTAESELYSEWLNDLVSVMEAERRQPA